MHSNENCFLCRIVNIFTGDPMEGKHWKLDSGDTQQICAQNYENLADFFSSNQPVSFMLHAMQTPTPTRTRSLSWSFWQMLVVFSVMRKVQETHSQHFEPTTYQHSHFLALAIYHLPHYLHTTIWWPFLCLHNAPIRCQVQTTTESFLHHHHYSLTNWLSLQEDTLHLSAPCTYHRAIVFPIRLLGSAV